MFEEAKIYDSSLTRRIRAAISVNVKATTLTVSWNWRNLAIQSYTCRPQITAFTILEKLSSSKMMSDASLATSVPLTPCTFTANLQQDEISDGRLRPRCRRLVMSSKQRCLASDWCRHLVNWTKHTRRLWFRTIPFSIWNKRNKNTSHPYQGDVDMMSSTNRKYITYRIAVRGPSHGHM